MGDWQISYWLIADNSNPEMIGYQELHGATIQPWQVMQWLNYERPGPDMLVTHLLNSLHSRRSSASRCKQA
jgi:hypothetical protein